MSSKLVTFPDGGGFDLCAWKNGKGLPQYPLNDDNVHNWKSCEEFEDKQVNNKNEVWSKTLPDLGLDLQNALRPRTTKPVPIGLNRYRVTLTFDLPAGAQIVIEPPTKWPDITQKQIDLIEDFYTLVIRHERGHQNILGQISQRFSGIREYPGPADYGAFLEREKARKGVAKAALAIEKKYDQVTAHGFKQSNLGGTDFPSLAHICESDLPITSTFDVDDEGWRATGDAVSVVPTRQASGGNPGPFVEIVDQAVNGVWYWKAPKKFLGDKSNAYGRMLWFDLKQSALDRPFDDVDIRLEGGDEALTLKLGSPPGLNWTVYAVALDETQAWVDVPSGLLAGKQEIETVLNRLTLLQIRGEYRVGPDTGGLDTVEFGVPK
jgi:hypothetical protein